MQLPEQPSCATCNFDPITDTQFPMSNTIDVDAYADRNNATDNVARQVYSYIQDSDDDCDHDIVTDNVTDTNGTESSWKCVSDRGGDKAARNSWGKQSCARDAEATPSSCMGDGNCWGNENSWGNENRRGYGNCWGAEPAVPKPSAGTIADTSDEDLAEYLIGHSVKIPFPPEYWQGDKRIYAGEAFDVTIKN
eukprot:1335919-Rhodomonas_salina.1